ncbi:hypothetical protein KJ765_03705 [Candidatus Micrarchaeota archaeon]|nr:hypothetical protein [Candidatus Micrarchaeota archaeon]
MKQVLVSLLLIAFLIMGCTQAPPEPVPTSTPALTVTPASTPEPTPSEVPEPTEEPTWIPTDAPNVTPTEQAYITSTPTPVPTYNVSEILFTITAELEDIGNEALPPFTVDYAPFSMDMWDADRLNNAREFGVEHDVTVSIAVGGTDINQAAKFGMQLRYEHKPASTFYRREGVLDARPYYVSLYSEYVPSPFSLGQSAMFFCHDDQYRVMVFIDHKLQESLLLQMETEPIAYLTEKLMAACPS